MEPVQLIPIGHVVSARKEPQNDGWDSVPCSIHLDPRQFSPQSLESLSDFSHVVVIYYMHKVDPAKIEKIARHPRNNPEWPKVGIFAQRGKNRPNQIGVSVCRVERVDGLVVHVRGLDAIQDTPVLDIKPWVEQFGPRGEMKQPFWMDELMQNYW